MVSLVQWLQPRARDLMGVLLLSASAMAVWAQGYEPDNNLATPGVNATPGGSFGLPRDPRWEFNGSPTVPSAPASIMGSDNLPARSGSAGGAPDPRLGNPLNSPRQGALTAREPSEFQKFVQSATGRLLPMFGERFFSESEVGQVSLENVPVSGDYTVGPGDELIIRAWGGIDVNYRAVVDRNGQINLPKVGTFNVAGVKASDLERHLRSQIGRIFTNFNLSVSLGQLRGVRVFVVGPALRPGTYTLPSQSTLLSAAVAAGGPGANGSMRKVLLRRDGRIISELDIYEFLVQGDKSRDVQLSTGDVVVFQTVGPRVALTGALDNPAIYELRTPQEPVREVLRYAGGTPLLANPNQALLERIDSGQIKAMRFVENLALDGSGLQKTLRDGDVLTLLSISPKFGNAVTLRGPVAQPLRYAYRPGMRIRDLIPTKETLIPPSFYMRKNQLVQIDEANDPFRHNRPVAKSANNRTGVAPLLSTQDQAEPRTGIQRYEMDPYIAPNPVGSDRNSSATDGSGLPGLNAKTRLPRPLFDDINWDYAVIERLNEEDLTTQLMPFNLGAAVLRGDAAHNLELKPGDVVTIYSQKDIRVPISRRTRLVTLDGEIMAPGIYQLQPGETLKELLRRAGGLSAHAYVYGLDFSREETRVRQQENLRLAVARLESLSATQAARLTANRRRDSEGSDPAAASNAATQAQIARLSRVEPNGRIALELSPQMAAVDELPDVALEHGDRISIPSRPGFVSVVGAVVNNNSFLWRVDRTVGDYIRQAGLDDAGDVSKTFVLRADGTVISAADRRGFLGMGGGLTSSPVYPGDTVVIPNQLDYESWGTALVRNLKDWSQILSQFGLGVAALKTLKD
jgi:polysaccharide biosynthesis/export protein